MSEDEDLARAIALSIEDTRQKEVIIIDDDEDDDDVIYQSQIKQALEASKTEAAHQALAKSLAQESPQSSNQIDTIDSRANSSFLSERAQLEKERRERQKRLRADVVSDKDDDDGEESDDDEPPAKRQHVSLPSKVRTNTKGTRSIASSNGAASTSEELFWDGECRQTATQHAEPRKDGRKTFRLTQILGKTEELSFAIMSSYALDFPWIYEFFARSVPVIMVTQPDQSGQASIKNVLPHWIKATPYLRAGYGCQHMKFMLLFHKTGRLRVVVSTANLIVYDWRDMENTVWLQDIPRRSSNGFSSAKPDDFPATLQRMLNSLNVRPALAAMIKDNHPNLPLKFIEDLGTQWDWSKVKAFLVSSLAGKHEGWPSVIQTGHPRLMEVVRKMNLCVNRKGKGAKRLKLECQGSSSGNYTTQWLNEFYTSACGESAENWLDMSKKRREKLPYPPVKIVFPTKKTVHNSVNGEKGGGTIFCKRKQWAGKNFPREVFHDSKSKAGPVLMHSKMILAVMEDNKLISGKKRPQRDSDTEDDEIEIIEPAVGWVYVGSHNFTPSAWGTLSGSGFNPVLNITNYEVGVIFPVKEMTQLDQFACWERPPKKYAVGDDEPWIQEESIYHQEA